MSLAVDGLDRQSIDTLTRDGARPDARSAACERFRGSIVDETHDGDLAWRSTVIMPGATVILTKPSGTVGRAHPPGAPAAYDDPPAMFQAAQRSQLKRRSGHTITLRHEGSVTPAI